MRHHSHGFKATFSRRKVLGLMGKALPVSIVGGLALGAKAGEAPVELGSQYPFYCPEAVEITEPGKMVRPDGTSYCGWSRQPYLDLNFEDARFWKLKYFQRYRYKKWEMYYIFTPTHYLHCLVAWIGYASFCDLSVYDRKTLEFKTHMHIRPPEPKNPMMRNSTEGLTEYKSRKIDAVFEVDGERRSLSIDAPGFDGSGFSAEIELLQSAGHESISGYHMTTPRRMHYGNKINCMCASGNWSLGRETFELNPEDCFGLLDFGRGFYPPRLFWYWATGSGRDVEGKLVGWNLGHGNNPEEVNENTLFYDGRLHKIGAVRCNVPAVDLYEPWKVWTDDGRVDLVFTPENVRISELNLGLLYTRGRPGLGRFNGTLVLDSGKKVVIQELLGLFEWVDQKW